MSPRSAKRGARISAPEVTQVSVRGFWLKLDGAEHFVAFAEFPFFRVAPVQSLFRVRRPAEGHLRWPDLDVDLELDSIREPARYPLVSKVATARVHETAGRPERSRAAANKKATPRLQARSRAR